MRNKHLDVLRCLAVFLVITLHGNISPFFTRIGWTGVDLFFVLSGFLISGLLFSEYKTTGRISFRRFFVRRGLKIYPSFYVFLAVTPIISLFALGQIPTKAQMLHNALFVMNYTWQNAWEYLWSLGVEEHFYVFLPLLLLVMVRVSADRQNPFRTIPWIWTLIAVTCMLSRGFTVWVGEPNFRMAYTATHNRVDSLFFGVLLGYLYHFRTEILQRLTLSRANCLLIGFLSAVTLSFAYFVPRETGLFSVFGYPSLYLGYGGLLLLNLYVHSAWPQMLSRPAVYLENGLAFVGKYSYSIYLWHGPAASWLPGFIRRTFHVSIGEYGRFAIYFAGSLFVGIILSLLIEYPILKLRDRIFPAKQIVAVA